MTALVVAKQLSHRYGKTQALASLDVRIEEGSSVAFIGPDGVGKSTLLGLIAGAKRMQGGALHVFGGDVRQQSVQRALQQRVAYMPQGLGRNLYPELSIRENLEFFGRLYGHTRNERAQRIHRLLSATGLLPFIDRPAGKLSGGMKQKLSLCCALIHDPHLLILDEPTTGVDPLSRQQFWALIDAIRAQQPQLTVLVATSYMEEAEQFEYVVMMDAGKIIAHGTAEVLKQRSNTESLEQAFIQFLPEEKRRGHVVPAVAARDLSANPIAIEAKGLTKRFGDFIAVDHVDFCIPKGEIYGFLGSNGCGKTTTMKMLTGLLPISEGESSLLGKPLIAGDIENRRRIGYMSQAFSLYGELSVHQNLVLHANLFGLDMQKTSSRLAWIYDVFGLVPYQHANAGALPLGLRQRLSLAVAVIHEPEVLILDEPTSGVDPIARDHFWSLLIELAHHHQVTIFVSTHFMNEAARCDRISLMHAGRVLASGTPEALRLQKQAATLSDAFVSYLVDALGESAHPEISSLSDTTLSDRTSIAHRFSLQRMMAYVRREALEMQRDPIRLGVATIGTALLMVVFGFGIRLDVDSLRYAVLDRDHSPESRLYIEQYEGSSYFNTRPSLQNYAEMLARMQDGEVSLALEIPPDFGKKLRRGTPTEISATIDGAMPFRAETIGGYAQSLHQRFLQHQGLVSTSPLTVESRYRYNQSFESVQAMVPLVMGLLLVFIPAVLSALSVVREKEMGSITNLYVTPTSRTEFILGKQIPYVLFSMVSFMLLALIALFIFHVPIKGSALGLLFGAFIYLCATTGFGLMVSTFTRSQIAALFGTAILTMMPASQFSGMLRPVSTLEGMPRFIGSIYPTTYFNKISIGVFTKGLSFVELLPFMAILLLIVVVLLVLNITILKKQEV